MEGWRVKTPGLLGEIWERPRGGFSFFFCWVDYRTGDKKS